MPWITTADQVRIYYEDEGVGEHYVFTSEIYPDYYCSYIRELVKRGYHLVWVQMRGYGKSSRVEQTDDIAEHWLPDMLAVADALGIEKFAYTGISHGTLLGWQMMRECPERILGFAGVVCGPNFKGTNRASSGGQARERDAERASTEEGWLAMAEEQRESLLNTDRPYMLPYWRDQIKRLADYEFKHHMAMDAQERQMNFGHGIPDGMDTEEELIAWMKSVKTPCLLMGGMKDAIIQPEAMFRSAQYVPHCKLVLYQDSDHGLAITHGQDLLEEVDRFFTERVFPANES